MRKRFMPSDDLISFMGRQSETALIYNKSQAKDLGFFSLRNKTSPKQL